MVLRLKIIFLIPFFSFVPYLNLAFSKNKGPPEGLSLGLAYIYSKSEYSGVSDNHLPMPFISYLKGRFFLRGFTAGYKVFKNGPLKASLLLDSKFFSGGYKEEDSSFLTGMDERKGTVLGGGQIHVEIWKFELKTKVMKDLLGTHGGIKGEIALGMDFPITILFEEIPFTMIGGTIGGRYNSESYNNYYFGVKESEVRANRPIYKTSNSWSPFFNFFVRSKFNEKWTFMTIYKLEWLSNKVTSSPIVEKKKIPSVMIFSSYQF